MKVYLRPFPSEIDPGTGIGRVVSAQFRFLPEFGITFTQDPDEADIIAVHTQQFDAPRVSILHTHGLYWSGDINSGRYVNWHHEANRRIVDAARRARIVTVPSNWVAQPFRRDMRISPEIIGHGIDPSEWEPGKNGGYVLWNKNRDADVCDPAPPWELASRGARVISTYAPEDRDPPKSLEVTGRLPFARMKRLIAGADVYLATVKETFGIGTLEAMACGVPVLGYRWGGTADLVDHLFDGYLVEPNDLDGLVEGLEWIRANRSVLSEAARAKAESYSWPRVMERYAEIYARAAGPDPDGVAVIIPNYNYRNFVIEAIESVLAQSYPVDEIVVVDDGSTDGSLEVIVNRFHGNARVKILPQANQGVAAARNHGIAAISQPFVICLDADDRLAPSYVDTCRRAMLADRGLGIAYTGLGFIQDGGIVAKDWPPEFSWERQAAPGVPPSSCVPSAAMFRRAMWERAGGYRQAYAPGEDTEFWTRGLSVGFTARKVSQEALFHYRAHAGSASRTKTYKPIDAWLPWMRDKQYPMGAPSKAAPIVRSYSRPLVSVIIPVGPGHAQYLPGALDSLLGQTFREWEVIVVNDQGDGLDLKEELRPYPFVELIEDREGGGPYGAGAARNAGLQGAAAPLVLFLDADDYLLPTALKEMVAKFSQGQGEYVYTDWQTETGELHEAPEYDSVLLAASLPHAVTVLMARSDAAAIGFDEDLESWEDWDFFARCAVNGVYGVRLPRSLLVYRTGSGSRRSKAFANQKQLFSLIRKRYVKVLKGGNGNMAKNCGGCPGGKAADVVMEAKGYLDPAAQAQSLPLPESGLVRMEYTGVRAGAVTYFGKVGRRYRFGNNPIDKYADVNAEDVPNLLGTGEFAVVRRPNPEPEGPRDFVPEPGEPQPAPVEEPEPEIEAPQPEPVAEKKPVKAKAKSRSKAKA